MKRNKWIGFLLCIVMFLGVVNLNTFISSSNEDTVKAENITTNPVDPCYYFFDFSHYISATNQDITYEIQFGSYYDTQTISPSSTDGYTIKTNIGNIKDTNGTLKITFFDRNNVEQSCDTSIKYTGNGHIFSLKRHWLLGYYYSLTTLGFDDNAIVYFGCEPKTDDTIYINYKTTNDKEFRYEMTPTGKTYLAPNSKKQKTVFSAPILTSALDKILESILGGDFSSNVTIMSFEIDNYQHNDPIIYTPINNPYGVSNTEWQNKIFFIDGTKQTWMPYEFEGYDVIFYPFGGINNNSITRTANSATNFTVTVPTPLRFGNYTFVGWYSDPDHTIPVDIQCGDTIFISNNLESYYGLWVPGKADLFYVDTNKVRDYLKAETGKTVSRINNVKITINTNSAVDMERYAHNSSIFKHVISFNGDTTSVSSIKISFYNNKRLIKTFTLSVNITNADERGTKYHFIVPNKDHPEDNAITPHIDKLYSISYRYGFNDNRSFVYNRLPISIYTVYPLFFELDNFTLEHWYTDENLTTKFEHTNLTSDIVLYSNYVNNYDYYIYIDNYQNLEWGPLNLVAYNDYFLDHSYKYVVGDPFLTDLGHNVYRFRVDISLSNDQFYLSGPGILPTNKNKEFRTESKQIETEYTYFDIVTDKNDQSQNLINTELYEHCLVGAQKVPAKDPSYKNSFRFSIGVPSAINDYYPFDDDPTKTPIEKASNLGFKAIFIRKDGTSYIGFWNFNPLLRSDALRLDKLYVSTAINENSQYAGFYSLTVRDDVAFKYQEFNHIIIVAVYKDTNNKLKIIKATEYSIVSREGGSVDIYYQNNHVIKPEGAQ